MSHLGALSQTRSQAIKVLIAPCGEAEVAERDKSFIQSGLLQFGRLGRERMITFNLQQQDGLWDL